MFENFISNVKDFATDTFDKAKAHPVAAVATGAGAVLFTKGSIELGKDVKAMFAAKKLAKENEAKAAEAAEVYDPETTAEATQG